MVELASDHDTRWSVSRRKKQNRKCINFTRKGGTGEEIR